MKKIYLLLAIVGTVIPYFFFLRHFEVVGYGLSDFITALFVNGAAGGFSADILISSSVFWCFMYSEKRVKKPWVFIILNLFIGLSCALPAYLYFREEI